MPWAADITAIPAADGWLYLAVLLDLYSRRIVGWALAPTLEAGWLLRRGGACSLAVVSRPACIILIVAVSTRAPCISVSSRATAFAAV